jgi:hypothetical protein
LVWYVEPTSETDPELNSINSSHGLSPKHSQALTNPLQIGQAQVKWFKFTNTIHCFAKPKQLCTVMVQMFQTTKSRYKHSKTTLASILQLVLIVYRTDINNTSSFDLKSSLRCTSNISLASCIRLFLPLNK